jgi:hypothetical protein
LGKIDREWAIVSSMALIIIIQVLIDEKVLSDDM